MSSESLASGYRTDQFPSFPKINAIPQEKVSGNAQEEYKDLLVFFFSFPPPHLFAERMPERRCAKALDVVTLPGQQYLQHHLACPQKFASMKAIAVSVQDKNSFLRVFFNNPQTT